MPGTVVQYAGRLHRAHHGKREALVYDYVAAELPVLRRMFAKRLKTYHALGYTLTEMQVCGGAESESADGEQRVDVPVREQQRDSPRSYPKSATSSNSGRPAGRLA